MAATISYEPSRVPGVRDKGRVIIRAWSNAAEASQILGRLPRLGGRSSPSSCGRTFGQFAVQFDGRPRLFRRQSPCVLSSSALLLQTLASSAMSSAIEMEKSANSRQTDENAGEDWKTTHDQSRTIIERAVRCFRGPVRSSGVKRWRQHDDAADLCPLTVGPLRCQSPRPGSGRDHLGRFRASRSSSRLSATLVESGVPRHPIPQRDSGSWQCSPGRIFPDERANS